MQLETKALSHAGHNAYRQDLVSVYREGC